MRVKLMLFAGVITGSLSATTVGQQPPDFSGTWRVSKGTAPAGIAAAPSPVFGEVFGIRQRGQQVELIRPVRGRETALVTKLTIDGPEQRAMVPARMCLGESGSVVTLTRDGQTLVYTLVSSIPPGGGAGAPVNLKYTFRLEAPDRLSIETTMRDSATSGPRAVGSVYQKSDETLPEGSASTSPAVQSARATISDVAWIAGHWVGGTGTTTYEERWTPPSGGAMLAINRTMRSDIMSAFEFLCIAERDSTLVYTAMPNGQTPTDFTLTKVDADSATFENPAHSFPKMIRYAKRPDGSMEAVISGAATQKPTTFVFRKSEGK
jgi:hypothetical protein